MANQHQIEAYFSHLVSQLGPRRDVATVAVAHMVPNTVTFAPALDKLTSLQALLPKPKSIARAEYSQLGAKFTMRQLTREWANDVRAVVTTLDELGLAGKNVVVLDIGGYFASSIDDIAAQSSAKILGVMEGTENGVQKYERASHRVPIVTVARSPLKLPEDYLVASSVVFSIEAVLREGAEILQTRSAAVIGYGRVGSSVAEILRGRGISTVVYDNNPIKLAEAAARGFRACRRLDDALAFSSLVVCATGNRSLDLAGFAMLRDGAVVASVTSADDEINLPALVPGYVATRLSEGMTQYQENRSGDLGRRFYLIANGNAANFLHGAVIGPAMQLIEGEKLAAVRELIQGGVRPGRIGELSEQTRVEVARIWNDHFL